MNKELLIGTIQAGTVARAGVEEPTGSGTVSEKEQKLLALSKLSERAREKKFARKTTRMNSTRTAAEVPSHMIKMTSIFLATQSDSTLVDRVGNRSDACLTVYTFCCQLPPIPRLHAGSQQANCSAVNPRARQSESGRARQRRRG